MSVPEYRRKKFEDKGENQVLDVIVAAEDLLNHTKEKMKGNKGKMYFSKSDTFTKKLPLLHTARKIYHDVRKANEIKAYSEKLYLTRFDLQLEALLAIEDLHSYLIDFDEDKPIDNIEYWIGLVCTAEKLLKGWIKSDAERWNRLQNDRTKTEQALKELLALPFGKI